MPRWEGPFDLVRLVGFTPEWEFRRVGAGVGALDWRGALEREDVLGRELGRDDDAGREDVFGRELGRDDDVGREAVVGRDVGRGDGVLIRVEVGRVEVWGFRDRVGTAAGRRGEGVMVLVVV